MLRGFNKKNLFTLYFSVIRPCLVMAQSQAIETAAKDSNEASLQFEPGEFSVAYVTVPNKDVGKTIAHGLINQKLAACVNIVPGVVSIYEWKDAVQEDDEALLMIKTRTSQMENLTKYVKSVHPYEVCEVISTPIQSGNPPYLKWISDIVPKGDL